MADTSVFITGAASEAFKAAFDGLPGWAREDTQKDVLKVLNEILKKSGMGGGVGDGTDSVENFVKSIDTFIDKQKKARDELDKERKERSLLNRNLKQELVYQFQQYYWAAKIYETMVQNVATFDKLNESGINVMAGFDNASNGFKAVQQLAVLTGVRFTELAETLVKYNTAVNVFGLGRFAKTLGNTSKELTQFGFSTKDAAELLGAYLESQRQFGDVNSRTQEEVQQDLVKFGDRIDRLSKATGTARQALLEQIKTISSTVEAQILSNQIGVDATQSTLEFIASFKDKKVGNEFLRMMTDAIKPLNATFKSFQKLGLGGFAQKMSTFTQSLQGLDPEEAQRRTAEFVKANRSQIIAMQQQANLYRQTDLAGEAEAVLSTLRGLNEQEKAYSEMSEEDREAARKSAIASKDLKNAFEKLMAQIQMFVSPLTYVMNAITKILSGVNAVFETIRNIGYGIESFFTGKEGTGVIFDILGAIVVGLAALKAGSVVLGRGKKGAAGGVAGAGAGAGGGGAAGAGAGGGRLAGMAEFFGKFLESIGTPRAMLGAVTMTILSANLYIVAKGLQEFANIEWESLGKGFVALAGLGVIAVALGSLSAVAGPGVLVLAGLGAALIPFGYAAKLAGEGMMSLGTGFEKLINAVNNISDISKFKELVETINKIDILKAGAFALISKIAAPSSSATPAAGQIKVGEAAEKVANSAAAISAGSAASAPVSNGADLTEINTLITLSNQLLEEIRTNMVTLISTNQDMLKYAKAKA